MFAQRVSSRFFTLCFSLLSGENSLICFTVLSLATIAMIIGSWSFAARAFACLKRLSCPAWR